MEEVIIGLTISTVISLGTTIVFLVLWARDSQIAGELYDAIDDLIDERDDYHKAAGRQAREYEKLNAKYRDTFRSYKTASDRLLMLHTDKYATLEWIKRLRKELAPHGIIGTIRITGALDELEAVLNG